MKTITSKVVAAITAALIIGGAAGAHLFPTEKTVVTEKVKTVEVPVEVEVEKVVEVEVPVEVIKEVVTNNEEYDAMLRVITDTNGDIELVVDDLDDLSVAEVSERFVFAADALALAAERVKHRGIDELDGMKVLVGSEEVVLDEDDMSRFRLEDEPGFVSIIDFDADEKDAKVLVQASVRQDGETFDALFEVTIRDGEYRRMEVVSLTHD